ILCRAIVLRKVNIIFSPFIPNIRINVLWANYAKLAVEGGVRLLVQAGALGLLADGNCRREVRVHPPALVIRPRFLESSEYSFISFLLLPLSLHSVLEDGLHHHATGLR